MALDPCRRGLVEDWLEIWLQFRDDDSACGWAGFLVPVAHAAELLATQAAGLGLIAFDSSDSKLQQVKLKSERGNWGNELAGLTSCFNFGTALSGSLFNLFFHIVLFVIFRGECFH